MFKPSKNYLIAASKQSRTPKNKIVVDGIEYLGDVIKTSPKISGCMTTLGDFPIKECTFEIYNFDNLNLVNKEVTVFKGLILEDGTVEYIQQGVFIATSDNITTSSTKKTISFKGKDKATVFDDYYGGEGLIEYPSTWGAFIQEICNRRGITLETPDFPLHDQILEKRPNFDINSTTERTIISQVAQLSGSVVQISRFGGLRIEKPVRTGKTIKRQHYQSLNKENKYGPVNVVSLGIEEGKDDIVYKNKESIVVNGETAKKINNNCFVSLNRETYIDLIGKQWDGIEFYPFTLENMIDDYCFDLGDVVTIIDKNNQEFETIILAYETTSRIFCKLYTNIQENSQLDYKIAGSSQNKIKQIQMSVDHLNNEFDVTAKMVDNQNEQLSKINLTLDNIKQTVEKTTTNVEELEGSINLFSVDLDIYNVIVPVDSTNKPIETKKYIVNYYSYFKGKQIKAVISSESTNEGISVAIENEIEFSVDSTKIIKSLNNEFIFNFSYKVEGVTYITTKKVIVTLACQGKDGKEGQQGKQGIPGEKGNDGQSTYFYIKYSENETGDPMTDLPNESTKFMGVISTTSAFPPTSYTAYTWSKIKGNDGIKGQPGSDGLSSYLHVKYSHDGQTFSEENGKVPDRWRGTYVDNIQTDSSTFEDYEWVDTAIFVDDELGELRESVNDNGDKIAGLESDLKENYAQQSEVDAFNSATKENLELLKKQFADLVESSTGVQITIGSILTDGISKVKTSTGFTFDENGLNISKDGEEMHSLMDNQGTYVYRDNEEILGADAKGVRGIDFWAKNYLRVGNNSRIEDYVETRTGIFYIGGGDS